MKIRILFLKHTYLIDCEETDTILTVKSNLLRECGEGSNTDGYDLIFNSQTMDETKTVAEYLLDDHELTLNKTYTHSCIVVYGEQRVEGRYAETDKVISFKSKLAKKFNIDVNTLDVMCLGRPLDNEKVMACYIDDIDQGTELSLKTDLFGKKQEQSSQERIPRQLMFLPFANALENITVLSKKIEEQLQGNSSQKNDY